MMRRMMSVLLMACLLLCGCSVDPEPTTAPTVPTEDRTVEPTAEPTAAPTTAPATEPATEPVTQPTEPPVVYRDPLSGEILEAPYVGRVFAVSINNVSPALPHHGVSQAEVYFEMFVNDYCTRGLALYTDIGEVASVGSVRSTRYIFTELTKAYDMIHIYAGGSNAVLADMRKAGIDSMTADGTFGYRDSDRHQNRGYAWEHTLFTTGEGAVAAARKKGFDLERKDLDYGLQFSEDGTPAGGEMAETVKIQFTLNRHTKVTEMKYDTELGKYVYWQYGKEMMDETYGQKEAFENVIVILAQTHNEGVYHIAELKGSGEGYFACGGQTVAIRWHRENDTDPFRFTLADGTPLTLGVGSSYIAIAPTESEILFG